MEGFECSGSDVEVIPLNFAHLKRTPRKKSQASTSVPIVKKLTWSAVERQRYFLMVKHLSTYAGATFGAGRRRARAIVALLSS